MKSRFVRVPSLVVVTAILSAGCGPSSEEPALPDGGVVADAGKPDLLDPARFRAAAQCADCDVLNIARLNLPATGVGAASAKMRAPDGRFFELTLRDSDERAEEATLLGDERRAVRAKYGKLQPELHAWTRAAAATDRAWVWIWASVPDYDVPREQLLTDPVFAAAHEERVKADLEAALGPIRKKLAGAELGEGSGPMMRARLTPDEVRALEALPQVALLGTDSYPGKGTSLPWSNVSQWNPTLRLDLANFVSTGAGVRVCVKEDGRPDDTSLLSSIVATANPSGPTSFHVRGMAGIIRNTLPPVSSYTFPCVAPGASVYIANWLGYSGSVDEWCRAQSANILSYSWEVAPAGTGQTATDWAHDWLAKNDQPIGTEGQLAAVRLVESAGLIIPNDVGVSDADLLDGIASHIKLLSATNNGISVADLGTQGQALDAVVAAMKPADLRFAARRVMRTYSLATNSTGAADPRTTGYPAATAAPSKLGSGAWAIPGGMPRSRLQISPIARLSRLEHRSV